MSESIMGKVGVKNLEVNGFFGIYESEKVEPQNILIDLTVVGDIKKSIDSDDIADAIDYLEIRNVCLEIAKEKKYNLIETYANDVLNVLFKRLKIVEASVLIKKFKSIAEADFVFVELSRKR